ncbi:alpha-L-rhamnosidase-related protein [Paenibacillus cymbidii]|uniref:alpha-L-rhamnosidase-related protein n=1 Tax=Paenibacillus cymbidii TaxID=1639034 RepID=UPI001436A913|nr:alpha-L-rhamnosidase C-terminal domain-containing protein [Paenibacillus cymbidii]
MEENRAWQASWIWHPERQEAAGSERTHDAVYLRRTFEVPAGGGCRLVADVSADSRYRLLLNGESVSVGPCKGDRWTHYYETVDLTDRLRPGTNVLAAFVVHYPFDPGRSGGLTGPSAVWRSERGVFLFEGALLDADGNPLEALHSDERWRVLRDASLGFQRERFTLFVGGPETVDGALAPHGWKRAGYDDGGWAQAAVVSATADTNWGQLTPWQLTPRPIPPLDETERTFVRVARCGSGEEEADAAEATAQLPADLRGVVVPAGATRWFELDAGEFATGYVRLDIVGGASARIGLICSECYEFPAEPGAARNKGVRDEWLPGKALYGPEDRYTAAGIGIGAGVGGAAGEGNAESYEPFWMRAFRFVRLRITAAAEPLVVRGLRYRDTGYPLDARSRFACSDDTFGPLWRISLNTLARCMHESYEDTPYYEQMQYEMDTRLQMLFTYYVGGDDRLARKAIYDFHSSLLPSGMLQARYPSISPQVIPGFALFWIAMVHDHFLHVGDASLVIRYRPTIDAVLDWFGRRVGADGLVEQLPAAYWGFVDWVEEWKETYGAPPANRVGPVAVASMMYADALRKAAELLVWTDRPGVAAEYRERAERICLAVRERCYDAERGLFRDGPSAAQFSQHAQIWAVLSGAAGAEEARPLLTRMLAEPELPRASTAFAFLLFRALERAGLYDRSFALWDMWREQLGQHVTAWVEDPVSQRSDCHGWGAAPLYEFPARLLGVFPLEPGYARIGVAPFPGPLQWAEGAVATVRGEVAVSWRVDESRRFLLHVQAPPGVPVVVTLPDGASTAFAEATDARLACALP